MPRACRCWPMAARARCMRSSMCRRWTSISMPLPATSFTAPPASARSTPSARISRRMRPFNGGGEMIREVTRERVTYADPPARFEAGTPPIIESVGLAAALDYMTGFDRGAVAAHEHDLLAYARDQVRRVQLAAGDRRRARQRRDPVIRGGRDACPRPRHHIGPRRRGGARRASLRPAADGAVRRRVHHPGQLRALQHARRSGRADCGPRQGPRRFSDHG